MLQYAIQYFMVCLWKLIDMAVTKSVNVNVRIQENIKQQAEQILETIGVPRATAIDMFYRQIILNKGIPFSLTIPKSLPAQDDMDEKMFNASAKSGNKVPAKHSSQLVNTGAEVERVGLISAMIAALGAAAAFFSRKKNRE